ncbi:MAG: hypothetical protein ACK58T_31180 [Phycisphaerae bacterium]
MPWLRLWAYAEPSSPRVDDLLHRRPLQAGKTPRLRRRSPVGAMCRPRPSRARGPAASPSHDPAVIGNALDQRAEKLHPHRVRRAAAVAPSIAGSQRALLAQAPDHS